MRSLEATSDPGDSCRTCEVHPAGRRKAPSQTAAVAGEAADVIGSWRAFGSGLGSLDGGGAGQQVQWVYQSGSRNGNVGELSEAPNRGRLDQRGADGPVAACCWVLRVFEEECRQME